MNTMTSRRIRTVSVNEQVLDALNNSFWKTLSRKALQSTWGKEDEVWDKFAEKSLPQK